ncbi:hypothetical protein BMR04_16150, partial [Methylococcaceae bacterium HT3]
MALTEQQASDDSWQQDVYTTALVLRTLQAYQSRSSGVNSSETGSVIGSVILSGSDEPIASAIISSVTQPGFSVFSGADGAFRLTGLTAGFQTLLISKEGYSGSNNVVSIYVGQQSDVGQIALALRAETGMIHGFVIDGHDQTGLAAVNINLTGSQSYQSTSNGAGELHIANIIPGSYTVTFGKAGYNSLTGQILISAG